MRINTIITALLILTLPALAISVQITGQGSSYTFNITDCTATNTTLNCSAETMHYRCLVDPIAFINNISFKVNGVEYATTQNFSNPNEFYLDIYKAQEYTSDSTSFNLEREQITDTNNVKVNAYLTATTSHQCFACNANFNLTNATTCSIVNTYILQHTSSNISCAADYNTTETCDYCAPNIMQNATLCSNAGIRNVSYFDTNYTTCCLTTGLSSDCLINTAPYQPHQENCNFYTNQFSCTYDDKPTLQDKINVICEMPDDSNYSCVINIYQNNSLLQTNPEYQSTTNFALYPSQQETRTSFTPTNRMVNAYYTQKQLRPDVEFMLEAMCTSDNATLISQYQINPQYFTPDYPVHWIKWVGDNAGFVLIGAVITIIATLIIFAIFRRR
jgi:hypothetical protein